MTLDILNWKPKTDIIHAVTVVPMLAPIITDIACVKVRRPAFTKLTVITVVAVDDWTAAVTNAPVSNPVNRFVVMAPRILRRRSPVNFWRRSLITFIPYIKRASEPSSLSTVKIVLSIKK